MIRRSFHGMGTQIDIGIIEDGHSVAEAEAAISSARQVTVRLESVLSRFIPDNDIDRLNKSNGSYVTISPATVRILRRAEAAMHESDGLFNPFLGAAIKALGYRQSFDQMDKNQPDPPADAGPELTSLDLLQGSPLRWSDQRDVDVALAAEFQVDLGGIAKGWIVEEAAREVEAHGFRKFVINAGGDMVCRGQHENRPWQIRVEHPDQPSAAAVTLAIESLALATSGDYRRRWKVGGHTVHHLIDPRTSKPADTDVRSCSVIHNSLVEAEWMAKKGLLLGSEAAAEWFSKLGTGYVLITKTGEVRHGGLAG